MEVCFARNWLHHLFSLKCEKLFNVNASLCTTSVSDGIIWSVGTQKVARVVTRTRRFCLWARHDVSQAYLELNTFKKKQTIISLLPATSFAGMSENNIAIKG